MRALWVLFVVACASGGDGTPLPINAPRIRVMTYNVNFGLVGDPQGVAAVASAAPDIVVLQETNDAWEKAFAALPFPHRRFQGPKNAWAAGGMGVLSKYPIHSIDQLDTDVGPFYAWRIVIEAPGGRMQILAVHLHPPMDTDSGSWVVGYFSTRTIREREAKDHIGKLAELPTIVAGDFNEEDEGRAIAVFTKQGFTSALPRFHPDADTWHWQVGGTTLRFRLDHILYDETAFRAVGAAVVDKGHSDHAPVWADLVRLR